MTSVIESYGFHPCGDRHTSWASLAACCWPHTTIEGDGPIAAASCGIRVAVLYESADQAQARKRSLDRDGCRPRCYGRHRVIDLAAARDNAKPPKPGSTVTRRATTPAAPPPAPKPGLPICGRPRTNGEPCRRRAGWGADPGQLWCRDHGGSTAERHAATERLADQALTFARLVEKARTTELTAEEQLTAEAAARGVLRSREGRSRGSLNGLSGWPFSSSCPEVAGFADQSLRLLVDETVRRLGLGAADGGM